LFFCFRGRGFSFKSFQKAKPGKFGILYRSLNDSRRAYTYRSHICAGRPVSNPTEHYVQGIEEVLMRTLKLYAAKKEVKGRNLTTDRLVFPWKGICIRQNAKIGSIRIL
jgi:hypothetical protein